MARLALFLTIALAAPAAAAPAEAAEPLTAETAVANYRRMIAPVAEIECPKARDAEEIVVCGRPGAKDPNRLPIPVERLPGEIVHGEPVSAVAAASTRERCSTVGPNQNCGGGLPVIPILVTAGKIIAHLIKGDD